MMYKPQILSIFLSYSSVSFSACILILWVNKPFSPINLSFISLSCRSIFLFQCDTLSCLHLCFLQPTPFLVAPGLRLTSSFSPKHNLAFSVEPGRGNLNVHIFLKQLQTTTSTVPLSPAPTPLLYSFLPRIWYTQL